MTESFSIDELAQRVNAWCEEHGVEPVSAQAGATVNERNIRFYRTLGLLDAPTGGNSGYGEKHLLQVMAIRLLQARGLPLRKIRELLFGRSLDELREILRRGLVEAKTASPTTQLMMPAGDELWRVTPIDEEFLIVSRNGRALTAAQRASVQRALQTAFPAPKNTKPNAK